MAIRITEMMTTVIKPALLKPKKLEGLAVFSVKTWLVANKEFTSFLAWRVFRLQFHIPLLAGGRDKNPCRYHGQSSPLSDLCA